MLNLSNDATNRDLKMKYELGFLEVNGHRAPAIKWEDGRIECGPWAERKHKEAGL